jgi:class 3 adenylate cyclase/tetratricopeptide (TPR) repeat protein
MHCPRCQRENRPQAKFCEECGAPLVRSCGHCGAALFPSAKFCSECGRAAGVYPEPETRFGSPHSYTPKHLAERILNSKAALEGERKQVTVLFVDVSGFTSMSERLDPEDVHGMMKRVFELILAEVHRYEGTVNQFLGDGVMALFGAPIAHEDHARRGVHAAVGIAKALEGYADDLRLRRSITFKVRQGLNTGLVVVGSIGSDLRMDYTAVGDVTNIAARMQQAAEPGHILISEATHRLVSGYFDTRDGGDLLLKGKAAPVRAWDVMSAQATRTRLDVEAERGLTPYIGREREFRILDECFELARTGHGQVVFVVGEPGIGKSRLLYEFRHRLGDKATWLEGRCMSFGRSIPLHPVIDMVKRTFRIEEGDTETTIATKVEQGVLVLGEDLRPLGRYLRYLLSVDPGDPTVLAMDPQQRRAEIFDALRRLLVRASRVRPQVMVIDDVHWIDKVSEESLLYSADSIPGARILQILTYRPGYVHPFGEHTYHTWIALGALSTMDSVQMAQAVLAAEGLTEELKSLIVTKAEGNPFFVEEVVKSLQEVGAIRRDGERYVPVRRLDEIVVPDTIQDVIMARIDRLEEDSKKTLQLAAVIGREFTRRLLDRIADSRALTEGVLRELKALELIYEKALFPELAYMFKHALTHDVAYHSLLVQRRKQQHRLIGLAIEELYAERLAEHYEVLAHHFSRAEDWAKALDYLLKAAEKATQAFANREAIGFYDDALEVAGRLGDTVSAATLMGIHKTKAGLYMVLSDFKRSRAEGERLLALAREAVDRPSEAAALAGMGMASRRAHDLDRALDEARHAIEVARTVDAIPVIASAHHTIGTVHSVTGLLDQAEEWISRAVSFARSAEDVSAESRCLISLALLKNWRGEYAGAANVGAEGLRIAREHNLLDSVVQGLWTRGLTLIGKGNYDEALATLEESLTFCERVGEEFHRILTLNTLGWLWTECGNLERGADLNRRSAEMARKRGDPEAIANSGINLGEILLANGDFPLAREVLAEVYGLVRNPATSDWMKWRYSTHLFAALGDLWLARGDAATASQFAHQCLELATRCRSRKYLVRGWRLQGEIALARRQNDEAEQALRLALEIAQAIGNPPQLWKTHVALGHLYIEAGRPELAVEAYQSAREVVENMKKKLLNPELRAGLENAPLIRQVYELSARHRDSGAQRHC